MKTLINILFGLFGVAIVTLFFWIFGYNFERGETGMWYVFFCLLAFVVGSFGNDTRN